MITESDSNGVAPLAGAWIEIGHYWYSVRIRQQSLPSRERGLKYCICLGLCKYIRVAPLAGAWIEITMISR